MLGATAHLTRSSRCWSDRRSRRADPRVPRRPALRQRRALARRADAVRRHRVRSRAALHRRRERPGVSHDGPRGAWARRPAPRRAQGLARQSRRLRVPCRCCPTTRPTARSCGPRLPRLRARAARGRIAVVASRACRPCSATSTGRSSRTRRAPPMLVMTCGLSGSGKTWLARRLAPGLRCAATCARTSSASVLRGLRPLADSRSPPDAGLYTREFNTRTYARLARVRAACLQGGENVVVDAAILRREERSRLDGGRPARRCADCDRALRRAARRPCARGSRRAAHAGADASEADVSLLDRQPAYWEAVDGRGASRHDRRGHDNRSNPSTNASSDCGGVRGLLSAFRPAIAAFPSTRCTARDRAPPRPCCR